MGTNPNLSALSSAIRSSVNPRLLRAAAMCVQAAAVKEIAATVPDPLQGQLVQRADLTINNIADDFCGTTFPLVPKPWPGPSALALDLATLLTIYANTTVQSGGLRTAITHIASHLVKKAYQTDGLH